MKSTQCPPLEFTRAIKNLIKQLKSNNPQNNSVYGKKVYYERKLRELDTESTATQACRQSSSDAEKEYKSLNLNHT